MIGFSVFTASFKVVIKSKSVVIQICVFNYFRYTISLRGDQSHRAKGPDNYLIHLYLTFTLKSSESTSYGGIEQFLLFYLISLLGDKKNASAHEYGTSVGFFIIPFSQGGNQGCGSWIWLKL